MGEAATDEVRGGASGAEAVGTGGGGAARRRAAAGFGGAAFGIARAVRAAVRSAGAPRTRRSAASSQAAALGRGGRDSCRSRVGGDRVGRGRGAWLRPWQVGRIPLPGVRGGT